MGRAIKRGEYGYQPAYWDRVDARLDKWCRQQKQKNKNTNTYQSKRVNTAEASQQKKWYKDKKHRAKKHGAFSLENKEEPL